MNSKILILAASAAITGCAVPSPQEYVDDMGKVEAVNIVPISKLDFAKLAGELSFGKEQSTYLEKKDTLAFVNAKKTDRGFVKVFKFKSQSQTQVFDVHAFPSKPLGFGQMGILSLNVFFFDSSGKDLSSLTEKVFFDYDRSFIDGEYFRAAFKLKNLSLENTYYAVVTSPASQAGKPMKSVTNYGGASVGVITKMSVQVSPVGKFSILQTDDFKK